MIWLRLGFAVVVTVVVLLNANLAIPQMHTAEAEDGQETQGGTVMRYCSSYEELYPGRLVEGKSTERTSWEGRGCVLKVFNRTELTACIREKKYVVFGDSLTKAMMVYIPLERADLTSNIRKSKKGRKASKAKPKYLRAVGSNGTNGIDYYWSPTMNEPASYPSRQRRAQGSISSADVVLLNSGMSDMGVTFCGVLPFYKEAKARIRELKEKVKNGSTLVVYPLHWLHRDNCPKTDLCYRCNHPKKVAVFREALHLAAACNGVPVMDSAPMTRVAPHHTTDGVHYHEPVASLQLDLLMNHFCREPPLRLSYPGECGEEEAMASWARVSEAASGCENFTSQRYACRGFNST